MSSFNKLEIYREMKDMAKEFRYAISNMPKLYKYNIGMRIINLLTDMKYQIYLCNTRRDEEKLKEMRTLKDQLAHLKIYLEECLEDHILHLKTKYSIQLLLRRLNNIISQANKWESYTRDILNRNKNKNDIDNEIDAIFK